MNPLYIGMPLSLVGGTRPPWAIRHPECQDHDTPTRIVLSVASERVIQSSYHPIAKSICKTEDGYWYVDPHYSVGWCMLTSIQASSSLVGRSNTASVLSDRMSLLFAVVHYSIHILVRHGNCTLLFDEKSWSQLQSCSSDSESCSTLLKLTFQRQNRSSPVVERPFLQPHRDSQSVASRRLPELYDDDHRTVWLATR